MDESNGLRKKKEAGNILIEVIYKPSDLILEQEIEDKSYTNAQVDSIYDRLDEFDYFTLKLSKDGKDIIKDYAGDNVLFNSALDYLSFQIGEDVKLVNKADTVSIYDFIYFSGYGVNNLSEILLVFKSDLERKEEQFKFLFDDRFFQTGSHDFEFDTRSIKDIPKLILK